MVKSPMGIVVLISGRGSNLSSIIHAIKQESFPARILAVISNRADAGGLQIASHAGIPTEVINDHSCATREEFDQQLSKAIDTYNPGLVVLAGFMRILGETFVRRYEGRLINIHPALLPKFPGLHTHERALESGANQHGATVHFVTPDIDAGPIIIQRAVPVLADDDADTLAARVLEQEHIIFPQAIKWFAEGRLTIEGKDVLLDGVKLPEEQS